MEACLGKTSARDRGLSHTPTHAVPSQIALTCVACGGPLEVGGTEARCRGCQAAYPVHEGIVCTDPEAAYWGNVPPERMEEVLALAAELGWERAVRERFPEYLPHLGSRARADAQWLWPIDGSSSVLDVGSMWGGLSFPVAERVSCVVAADKTLDSLRFLQLRSEQEGRGNITAVQAGATALPFPDASFDHAILNGVLEWVAFESELVVETHWKGDYPRPQRTTVQRPNEVQMQALKEIRRVLRPEGSLYLAIENRWALGYFCGWPDDHVNLRFLPLLPRFVADRVSRLRGKGPYRTWIHSERALVRMLGRAGFTVPGRYAASPHYIQSRRIFPLDEAPAHRAELAAMGLVPRALLELVRPLVPRSLIRRLVPSFALVAARSGSAEPRILRALREAKAVPDGPLSLTLIAERHEDVLPVSFALRDESGDDVAFCKVARDSGRTAVPHEAEILRQLATRLHPSTPGVAIPELRWAGRLEGTEALVTSLLTGSPKTFRRVQLAANGLQALGRLSLPGIARRAGARVLDRRLARVLHEGIPAPLEALISIQRATTSGERPLGECLRDLSESVALRRPEHGDAVVSRLKALASELPPEIVSVPVPRPFVHGDFDLRNILTGGPTLGIVDWEDAEPEGWPFIDLGNLVGNPLVVHHRALDREIPFSQFLHRSGLDRSLRTWLEHWCESLGLPRGLLPWLLVLASAQQAARQYPVYREAASYPLYGAGGFARALDAARALEDTQPGVCRPLPRIDRRR